MKTYISLLRGVGGKKIVPVKDLREIYEALGCESVTTYIATGNVVFRTDGDIEAIQAKAYTAIEERLGFTVLFFHRTLAEWREIVAANPFPTTVPRFLHCFLLEKSPDAALYEAVLALRQNGEELAVVGHSLYFYTPNGFGTSKLAGNIERKLKMSMTARNWNSMMKLLALAEAKD